jgi:PDZ domain-containing protein
LGGAFAIGNDGAVTSDAPEPQLSLTEAPLTRRGSVIAASGLATSLLIAVLTVIPAPYAIGTPGPTFDTLGEVDGVALVTIEGAPTFEASGELRLTTVSQARGTSSMFTVGQVIGGYFSPTTTISPEEAVFGRPEDREASENASAQEWITSQESATVSALEALDRPVPAVLTVVEVAEQSGGFGILEVGDVIIGFDGDATQTYSDLSKGMEGRAPGETVSLTVEREGVERDIEFPLIDNGLGEGIMGIWIDPQFQIPINVAVKIDTVGGPSAGSMFALAIMDMLTAEDELNGARVAGTGTITADGDIGAIGGVHLKMAGARAAGADYFLVPTANCPGVVGHIPAGLNVYAVDTLDEAYDAVVAIGQGNTDDLPTCTQSKDDS